MDHEGLQLDVRRFCGAPLVTARGRMDGRHNGMLHSLLRSFKWKGYDNIILDLSEVSLVGTEGRDALLEVMNKWSPEMDVHLVAAGEVAAVLGSQSLPFRSHLCSSVDLAAEEICRMRRDPYRSIAAEVEDGSETLRLAA
ncbi:MAG: hypothetical protein Q7T82_00335 [Armatimonadota bacterium]|nr:hypothetical protein [Armatimonadota bacterium]